jgi:hypothetical protein
VGIEVAVSVWGLLSPHIVVVQSGWLSADRSRGWLLSQMWSLFTPRQLMQGIALRAAGLAGWVVGIVAAVTNRGRPFGIAAVVIATILFLLEAVNMGLMLMWVID